MGFGGLSVGFTNLYAAICVGILGSTVVVSHANLSSLFVKLFISEVFAEAIGLIGLICGIVMGTIWNILIFFKIAFISF